MVKEAIGAAQGLFQSVKENGLAITLATILLTVGMYHTWRLDERHNELQSEIRTLLVNQVEENSKALASNSKAIETACEQGSATRKAVEKNTEVLGRIERVLDKVQQQQ